MKTKEINVWLNHNYQEEFNSKAEDHQTFVGIFKEQMCSIHPIKAKLIIEISEKKIEITEGDIESAFKICNEKWSYNGHDVYLREFKKELGF